MRSKIWATFVLTAVLTPLCSWGDELECKPRPGIQEDGPFLEPGFKCVNIWGKSEIVLRGKLDETELERRQLSILIERPVSKCISITPGLTLRDEDGEYDPSFQLQTSIACEGYEIETVAWDDRRDGLGIKTTLLLELESTKRFKIGGRFVNEAVGPVARTHFRLFNRQIEILFGFMYDFNENRFKDVIRIKVGKGGAVK